MSEKRRDNRNRILHVGESQRQDGRYAYKYKDLNGDVKFVYSWRLDKNDRAPAGKARDLSVADMYEATEEELALFDRAIGYVERTYGEKLDIFRACARIVDLHAKGVSKLRSARLLQQELGKRILVCVGDAENDINMLDGADYAYCPADGIVAERYETVCNCADGAVADVIYKKLPAILPKQP